MSMAFKERSSRSLSGVETRNSGSQLFSLLRQNKCSIRSWFNARWENIQTIMYVHAYAQDIHADYDLCLVNP